MWDVSHLVNMTLAYLRGTYNEGITYCDLGAEGRNKLTGWADSKLDSDFAADPDTRKSMTGYRFSLKQFRGADLDRAVSLSAALKPSLWQRHRRAKKPSICERCCGVSTSDRSAPQKYGKIMPFVLL